MVSKRNKNPQSLLNLTEDRIVQETRQITMKSFCIRITTFLYELKLDEN